VKKSRFADSQIMAALKRVQAGLPVPDICRELCISSATFYKWRAKFGGMDTIHDGPYEGARGREPAPQENVP
jgi:putative transposase